MQLKATTYSIASELRACDFCVGVTGFTGSTGPTGATGYTGSSGVTGVWPPSYACSSYLLALLLLGLMQRSILLWLDVTYLLNTELFLPVLSEALWCQM